MVLFSQEKRKRALTKKKKQPLQIYFISPFQLNPEHCVCVSQHMHGNVLAAPTGLC